MSCRGLVLPLFIIFVVASAFAAEPTELSNASRAEARTFDIPQGPARFTLKRFATQSGTHLLYASDDLTSVNTRPVRGNYPPEIALSRMIEGSPLVATYDARTGAFTLTRPRPPIHPAPTVPSKASAPVSVEESSIVLSPFEVLTNQDEGYRASNTASGNKVDTPIRETPQSIQIVNAIFMEDIQARSLADALVYTSGITEGQSPRGDRFEIRGFLTGIPFKNGFRDTGRAPRDTANFDRIEIAKGPAGVIFSRTSAGGMVNIITKLPQPRRFLHLDTTVGGFDYLRSTLDFNAPLGEKVFFRLNAAFQDTQSFRTSVFARRLFVAPTLSWMLGANTRLNVEFEYLKDDRTNDAGLVAAGPIIAPVDPATFYGDPDDINRTRQITARYELLHSFASGLSLRHATRVNQTNERGYDTRIERVNPATYEITRTRRHLIAEGVDNFYLQTDLTYEQRGERARHTLLAGMEIGYNDDGGITDGAPLTPTHVINPQPGVTGVFINDRWADSTTWVTEYFLQDQVYFFGDRLSLLAGARFSRTESYSTNKRVNTTQMRSNESWNPRYGLVWLPKPSTSIFLNFSQLASAVLFANPDGRRFDPTIAELAEGGVRFELLDRRFFLNASLYQLRNTRTLIPDPQRADYFIATGEQRTRGLEFDFVGKPTKNWQWVGSANVADALFSRHTGELQGNRRINTPSHTYSIWTRYDVTHDALRGAWVGVGLLRLSGRYGDAANSFYVPSYLRIDASVGYGTPRWDVALMVKNLNDQKYIRATSSELSVYPGSPLDYSIRLRVRF